MQALPRWCWSPSKQSRIRILSGSPPKFWSVCPTCGLWKPPEDEMKVYTSFRIPDLECLMDTDHGHLMTCYKVSTKGQSLWEQYCLVMTKNALVAGASYLRNTYVPVFHVISWVLAIVRVAVVSRDLALGAPWCSVSLVDPWNDVLMEGLILLSPNSNCPLPFYPVKSTGCITSV